MLDIVHRWFQAVVILLLLILVFLILVLFHHDIFGTFSIKFLWTELVWRGGIIAMLIGGSVGAVELIGRYQDAPFRALMARGALAYVVVNATLSVAAFAGLLIYVDTYKNGIVDLKSMLTAATIAGFGSLAIMRSAIAKTQIAGNEISVGPSFFIDVLLKANDRSVDRSRAIHRLIVVPDALGKISGKNHTIIDLFLICANSLQNLDIKERDKLETKLAALVNKGDGEERDTKMVLHVGGMLLQQMIGTDAFRQACVAIDGMELPEIESKDFILQLAGAGEDEPAPADGNGDDPGDAQTPDPTNAVAPVKPEPVENPVNEDATATPAVAAAPVKSDAPETSPQAGVSADGEQDKPGK